MFTKVLIAEDVDLNDLLAVQMLQELQIPTIDSSKYCDEALLKIKKAQQNEQPYELLISDLSFKPDHRKENLKSGPELIQAVKKLFPQIKIIVFSNDEKTYTIKNLLYEYGINGYVAKGRDGIGKLKKAIEAVYESDEKYLPLEFQHIHKDKTVNEITNYDIQILKHLSQGVLQVNMEAKFKALGISPNDKSTIEKHINKLKVYFDAKNTTHIVSIAKDLGLI
jgi:two-component system, NarL family, captular synthesis response regulator RcsB